MENKLLGYVRVSTREQKEDRQVIALMEYGVPKAAIYTDKVSGKDFDRRNYKRMLKKLKKGNILVVKSIDRLGRNYEEIIEQWRYITKEIGADIVILDIPILNTNSHKDLIGTLVSDIVLQLLSFVAQNERENIRQRQAEGIAAAKARGVKFGRPIKYIPENHLDIIIRYKNREVSRNETARLIGCSPSTLHLMINKLKKMGKLH